MVKVLNVGDAAPQFDLPAIGGSGRLADHAGKWVVLYFYPRDDTPGCTTEAKDFTGLLDEFAQLDAVVIGVSRDSLKKHEKFADKHSLGVILVSDEDGDDESGLCVDYGVWVEKNMYGKTYLGIQRATFLIGPDGKIAQIWPKVKVKGHAEAVRDAITAAT